MKRILLCIIFITITALCSAVVNATVDCAAGPPTWGYTVNNQITSTEEIVEFTVLTGVTWGDPLTINSPANWTGVANNTGGKILVEWSTGTAPIAPGGSLAGFSLGSLEANEPNSPWTTTGDLGGTDAGNTDAPLPVELSSFMINLNSQNYAVLNWTTQSESENMGWNVYRATTDVAEEAEKITQAVIPGSGTSTIPVDYQFTDEAQLTEGETYWYWIESVSLGGEHHMYNAVCVKVKKGKVPEDTDTPGLEIAALAQNYPNPFNPTTIIEYNLSEVSDVHLEIFNTKGQLVKSYSYTSLPKGKNSTTWDGKDSAGNMVGSGTYLYKLTTSNFTAIKKAVLIK